MNKYLTLANQKDDIKNKYLVLANQKNDLLEKINNIEKNCNGIENEENAKQVTELNLEKIKLVAKKHELSEKISILEDKISKIDSKIKELSDDGVSKILQAIKEQRWYYFKNKVKVFFDKNTGLLWGNLDYFPYNLNSENFYQYNNEYYIDKVNGRDYDFEFDDFRLPTNEELYYAVDDNSIPINSLIFSKERWYIYNGCIKSKHRNDLRNTSHPGDLEHNACLIPCSDVLIKNSSYVGNIFDTNNFTEKERLQFTLDLFVKNELLPNFNNDEVTELYKNIYFEKPKLLKELQELQEEIEKLQEVTVVPFNLNYEELISKYDIKAIDSSVIKYYKAIQQWCNELIDKLECYEKEKETIIKDFDIINLKISKKYNNSSSLTVEENNLLSDRQKYLKNHFSISMNSMKMKILSVKKQADDLESRINKIDEVDDSIYQLGLLEQEKRASFSFITENTVKIIKNTISEIEFFEQNHNFIMNIIDILEKGSNDYKTFKTTYKQDIKNKCKKDNIKENIWCAWCEDWRKLRYIIEQKVQLIIERELRGKIELIEDNGKFVSEQISFELEKYKNNIDNFYKEERKDIYQKYAKQKDGELQDKLETEKNLYKYKIKLQTELQNIIFNCKNVEDKIFMIEWASDLLGFQIDELLEYVKDKDLRKISKEDLNNFILLKQKDLMQKN